MNYSLPETPIIAVIGLGYIGLPLAVEFGKQYQTIGYDLDVGRIGELKAGKDKTLEVEANEISSAGFLSFSSIELDIAKANIYIVTVPTPIDENKEPNLIPLQKASETVGRVISESNIVIYESTVFPGATEELCVPIIEKLSGLSFNKSFYAGYSPERVNPGDPSRRLTQIIKVTSGSTPVVANYVDSLYASIILAGTYQAETIKIAEAAKVIENTQRDVNIALVNELAMIFEKLDIDTQKVLDAAATKWNFLPFKPGLVGGHCIGVDPYYLTRKAQEVGHNPEIILSGRKTNDDMGKYIANRVATLLEKKGKSVSGSKVLVLGLAFKENCPDIRNTRVADLVDELKNKNAVIDIYDPWVDKNAAIDEFSLELIDEPKTRYYDAVILAVAHKEFVAMTERAINQLCASKSIIYDVKSIWPEEVVDERL